MDNRLEQDALIEDALQNYPLAPMPRDITASVMARIHVEKRLIHAAQVVRSNEGMFIDEQRGDKDHADQKNQP